MRDLKIFNLSFSLSYGESQKVLLSIQKISEIMQKVLQNIIRFSVSKIATFFNITNNKKISPNSQKKKQQSILQKAEKAVNAVVKKIIIINTPPDVSVNVKLQNTEISPDSQKKNQQQHPPKAVFENNIINTHPDVINTPPDVINTPPDVSVNVKLQNTEISLDSQKKHQKQSSLSVKKNPIENTTFCPICFEDIRCNAEEINYLLTTFRGAVKKDQKKRKISYNVNWKKASIILFNAIKTGKNFLRNSVGTLSVLECFLSDPFTKDAVIYFTNFKKLKFVLYPIKKGLYNMVITMIHNYLIEEKNNKNPKYPIISTFHIYLDGFSKSLQIDKQLLLPFFNKIDQGIFTTDDCINFIETIVLESQCGKIPIT